MEPVRTCVGCRQLASKSQLIRVVGSSNLMPDRSGCAEGRGAWLHPSGSCLKLAIERNSFVRALRLEHRPDAQELITYIEQAETMLAKNE